MPFISNIIVQKEINLSSIEVYSSYAVGNILVDLGHTQGADENDTCYVIDRAVRYPEGTPSEWKELLKNGFAKMMETALFSTTRYDGLTLCAVSDMASEKHLRFLAIFKDAPDVSNAIEQFQQKMLPVEQAFETLVFKPETHRKAAVAVSFVDIIKLSEEELKTQLSEILSVKPEIIINKIDPTGINDGEIMLDVNYSIRQKDE